MNWWTLLAGVAGLVGSFGMGEMVWGTWLVALGFLLLGVGGAVANN